MADEGCETEGRTKIHNVRFYNLAPRFIHCMAYDKISNKLAVGRNDGSIEIWDMEYTPVLEKLIPKSPGNSIEGLAWSGSRLFSVGLSGELVEWNLQIMQPRRKQHVTGSAIWCLDINRTGTELAIGTEEGYISVFDITDDQMQYKHLFDKHAKRVLCCKFDRTGELLVTGSVGTVCIWDVDSGHLVRKMTVARAQKRVEVIVWSLQVLSDFTILTADSRGFVVVWDGDSGTEIETMPVLKADALALAVNGAENVLMVAGIDPVIRLFARTNIKREESSLSRWVRFLQRNVHDHDVRALICAGDRIISGGMDSYLGISSLLKKNTEVIKYGPFLQNPCVTVAPLNDLLLLRYSNYLEIWRLGSSSENTNSAVDKLQNPNRNLLSIEVSPEKLVEFRSKHDEPIVCATISPDGKWMCYSTQREMRLFKLFLDDKHENKLSRIKDIPEQCSAASHVNFGANGKRLFLVNAETKQILVFSIISNMRGCLDFSECIDTAPHIKDAITIMAVSQCGIYIAAAGADRTIAVWSVLKSKHFQHLLNLPNNSAPITALALHPEEPKIVAAFSDNKIMEYDLGEKCLTCKECNVFTPNGAHYTISNIALTPRNPDVFIMHNDVDLFVLEKNEGSLNQERGDMVNGKKARSLKRAVPEDTVCSLRLKYSTSAKHLIHLSWLSTDELVSVGVNPISILQQLPDAYKQKKFGAA